MDQGNRSLAGEIFQQHHNNKGADFRNQLPVVEVCIKVLSIADIEVKTHSYYVEFIVMYDWLDPSLHVIESGQVDQGTAWEQHFYPYVELLNCIERVSINGSPLPRRKGTSHRVTQTERIAAKLRTKYDLRQYPFDHQYLQIHLKSRGVAQTQGKPTLPVRLGDPVTWRGEKGHKIDSDVDWLGEWDIVMLDASPDGKHGDNYRLQICVLRDSHNVFWNLVLSNACIISLSFTAFALYADELFDRLTIVTTMIFACMNFKFVLAEHLPVTPYLTIMDRYVMYGLLTITAQGLSFWIVDLINSYVDEHATRYVGVSKLSAKVDVAVFIILLLAQMWAHGYMIYLFINSTAESLVVDKGKALRCVIRQPKKTTHNATAAALHNGSSSTQGIYSSNDIFRPFPFPALAEPCET